MISEKIKTFLREFYVDGEDGGKDFVYGQQLVIDNRRVDFLRLGKGPKRANTLIELI